MNASRTARAGRQEHGQDLVELALLLPLLILILMIVIDFSRAFNTYMVLTNAAREGVRQAAMQATTSSIMEAARHETRSGGLDDADVTISVVQASSGSPARVTVEHNFVLLSGVLPFATVPLEATVEMVAF